MIIFEIIFFALLSLYLFVRLWSVFGDRSGFDSSAKKNKSDSKQASNIVDYTPPKHDHNRDDESNVIPLHGRHAAVIVPEGAPFQGALDIIQQKDTSFTPESFVSKGVSAFKTITRAFVEGDRDTLTLLLTPVTYGYFDQALKKRAAHGHRLEHDIVGDVRCIIDDAHINKNIASITLKFTSHQRLTTFDHTGKVIDNPEDIAVKMVNYWTFERDLSTKNRVWQLAQTRVDDAP